MLYKIIENKRSKWIQKPDCPIKDLMLYTVVMQFQDNNPNSIT